MLLRIHGTKTISKLQAARTSTLKQAQEDFKENVRYLFEQVRQSNSRLIQQLHEVDEIRRRQAVQEKEQDKIRDAVARLVRTIALAESAEHVFDAAKLAN